MAVVVRPIRRDEARLFLEIHRASVRGLASKDYPEAVVDEWAPVPITDDTIKRFDADPDHEIRLMADLDGEIVGLGVLVVNGAELRACYVHPSAARKGVGSALVKEIELRARDHGLTHLELVSSLTAEPFYAAHGYQVVERIEHVYQSGVRMARVTMRKQLE